MGWPIALVIVVLALYANALNNPFLSDDGPIIERSPTITTPSVAGLVGLWTTSYWQVINPSGHTVWLNEDDRNLYRPITIFSFWLNRWIAGVTPWAFRIVNVLLHAGAAWMLGCWCAAWAGPTAGIVAAWVVLLHPIATDVINRIVGRADIFVLLGVAGFLATQRRAQTSTWTWGRMGAAALWTSVALGAKESGVIIFPLAAVQTWLARLARTEQVTTNARDHGREATWQRSGEISEPGGGEAPRRAWRGGVALAVPALAYALGRTYAVQPPNYGRAIWDLTGNPLAGLSFWGRLPGALSLAYRYVRLLVWPYPLLSFNLAPHAPRWSDPDVWVGMVLVMLIGIGAVVAARRRPLSSLATAWWLASFAIVSQLLVPIGTYMELRLAYPMIGALAAAAASVAGLRWWTSSRLARIATRAVVAVAAVTAVALILTRNVESASDITLAEADVRHQPGDAGQLIELAGTYEGAGRSAEAEKLFIRATELAPASSQAWYELGAFHAAHGRRELGKRMYERALAANPSQTVVLLALATTAIDEGDLATAERLLTSAQQVDPDNPYVEYNLAVLDDTRRRPDAAMRRLEGIIARRPDFRRAVDGLAALKGAHPQPDDSGVH